MRKLLLLVLLASLAQLAACGKLKDAPSSSDVDVDSESLHDGEDGYWYSYETRTFSNDYYSCMDAANAITAPPAGAPTYLLQPAVSCDDATAAWRRLALVEMRREVARARCEVLYPPACETERIWVENDNSWGYDATTAWDAASYDTSEPAPDGASEYSTTNTQEVGVDEADFIKNDGNTIYILADGALQIIDAWPPDQSHVLSVTPISGTPRSMFVHNGVAVVYSSEGYIVGSECTYGYDCDFVGDGNPTQISVFDLTDLTQPVLVREVSLDASFISARRIDNFIYTVTHMNDPVLPSFSSTPAELQGYANRCADAPSDQPAGHTAQEIEDLFAALELANEAEINAMAAADWLPSIEDARLVDSSWQTNHHAVQCDQLLVGGAGDGRALLSVTSFDLTAAAPLSFTGVVGRPGAVYGSQQALYVAQRHQRSYMDGWFEGDTGDEASTVHKFALSAQTPDTTYVGSGLVKGRVLNQFAMSEYGGYLRLATTSGYLPSPDVHSTVTVLQEQAGELQQVGQLDNLAPSEDIRSVRFMGEKGFIVTFKKTDPLFALDLADPTNPTVLGELKIPGFSTYMHFMDPTHILSIGYDADDQGSFAFFQGIILQIFDVTDMTAPTLVHKETIGTRGTTSEAATNHLAFNFFPSRNLLAVPMTICEDGSGGGTYGDEMTFDGLMVYNVTVADGFTYQGGLPHPVSEEQRFYGCGTWWTDSRSTVQRSVFMDNWVFSVARELIRVADLADLANPVTDVVLVP